MLNSDRQANDNQVNDRQAGDRVSILQAIDHHQFNDPKVSACQEFDLYASDLLPQATDLDRQAEDLWR